MVVVASLNNSMPRDYTFHGTATINDVIKAMPFVPLVVLHNNVGEVWSQKQVLIILYGYIQMIIKLISDNFNWL